MEASSKRRFENFNGDEKYLMDFLKFALMRVYMDYKHGHAPSAAEVWGMIENGQAKGCLACAMSSEGGNCASERGCVAQHGDVALKEKMRHLLSFSRAKVKLLEDVKNDGTYPYLALVRL